MLALQKQQGVSLIESMIALLVISIGLLGIAALQITAMSQNTSALHHSQAVWIANNMADRIRANRQQFARYNSIDTDKDYSQDCINNTCTPAQTLTADAADWKTLLGALPSGRGIITTDSDIADNSLILTVHWNDEGTDASKTGCDPKNKNDLTCYRMVVR